jgi:hypothetical protein
VTQLFEFDDNYLRIIVFAVIVIIFTNIPAESLVGLVTKISLFNGVGKRLN